MPSNFPVALKRIDMVNYKFIFHNAKTMHAFGVLPVVPMAYQCHPKFCHWQSLVTIGTNSMPMATIGCQWVLPFGANLADILEGRQNYQKFSRYPEAVALPSIETERVAEALIAMFSRVGIPSEMLNEHESRVTIEVMNDVIFEIATFEKPIITVQLTGIPLNKNQK